MIGEAISLLIFRRAAQVTMKMFSMAVGAALALVSVTDQAQAQTLQRQAGSNAVTYRTIESEVLARQMAGMRVSAKFEECSANGCSQPSGIFEAVGFWTDFGADAGVDLRYNNTLFGTIRIAAGASTFNSPYTFNWNKTNDFRTLKFEGGPAYGNVLFDIPDGNCGTPSITCARETTGSSTGNEFDIQFSGSNLNAFANTFGTGTVTYSNLVSVLGQSTQYDLFSTVEMVFPISLSGPDNGQAPFTFQMDTDLGRNVVPEPSTYALMGAGLISILGFARRRNRNA